jgi:5'-deoxynucleotidase YfbR-like HD superfamily hydrolase
VRFGNWMQTFGGRQFWPLDPRPEDVELEDIAHALANICRFGGHCREFYSVAQHSVLVSRVCPMEDALGGLLHDAAEAYVGDMIRPLKRMLDAYASAEVTVARAIGLRFGLDWLGDQGLPAPKSVKLGDEILLATEARDLMSAPPEPWVLGAEPMAERIVPLPPREAEALFLARFAELSR